ncbi:hypothetical protein BJV78DRAFT_594076 [Lactifluus subvellereus]|nr:hypothetical protein BJV78DRAFT_594076 [Lactifluus subvellereus]
MLKPLIYCNVLCLLSCAVISQCFKLVRDPRKEALLFKIYGTSSHVSYVSYINSKLWETS